MRIKNILFSISIFFFAVSSSAQTPPIDEAMRFFCNQVMLNIYQDILSAKRQYSELRDFGENTLTKNSNGIYRIDYTPPLAGKAPRRPSGFGLTIERIDDKTFADKTDVFSFTFPLLGLKFSGYQPSYIRRKDFDLRPLINRNGIALSLEEQKRLPLRLEIKSEKDTFKVNEPIEFEVILTNVGPTNIFIKKLDYNTVYFLINNEPWGTPPSTKTTSGERTVVKTGESIRTRFEGESFKKPTEVELHAIYHMLVKGINPFATMKIRVVE